MWVRHSSLIEGSLSSDTDYFFKLRVIIGQARATSLSSLKAHREVVLLKERESGEKVWVGY